MKHCTLLLLALVVGCAESGGYKPGSSSSSGTSSSTTAAAPAKRDRPEGAPLVWKPTTNPASLGAVDLTGLGSVKLQVIKVADGRQNPMLLGENKEKSPARVITTNDDVPAFVTEHLKQLIAQAGINVVDSGPTRILRAELKQFYVEEIDTYKGDVRMVVSLTDAGSRALWTGTTGGSAQRFGRSYKADNYYETLSDSLIEATYNLIRNPGFHDALVKP
jgi:hypothetical protein